MRALNKSWIGIILVILFGASLFFFRGSARYSNLFNSDNFVANVSGTPISTTKFLRSLEMNIGQFAQMLNKELTGDEIRSFQIHQLVLQNLVNNAIFENEFDEINFFVDDSTVAKETKKRFPNLYTNNSINDDALNSFLKQQRLKINDLVDIINYETRSNIFDNIFFEKSYPSKFTDKINIAENQKRELEVLRLPFNKLLLPNFIKSEIKQDDEELLDYYMKNTGNYMTSEKRDISYLIINKNSYEEIFTPSNNEVREYFENNKDFYKVPEKRSFKQFNFKTEEEANNFKINTISFSNNEIDNFAKQNDITYNQFENLAQYQVLDELAFEIFSLNENQVSDVIKTTLAYHVIVLDKIQKEQEAVLDDQTVNEIKNNIKNVKIDGYFNDLKTEINQKILNGSSIIEIAESNNLKVESITNTINKNIDGKELESNILKKAFTINKDFVSDVIDYDLNTSYIVNVDKIYPSKPFKIENIFDELLEDFIIFKKISLGKNKYQEHQEQNDLEKVRDFFKKLKVDSTDVEILEIERNNNDLPKDLVDNIFNQEQGDLLFTSNDEAIFFAKIKNIKILDTEKITSEINIFSDLKNAFGSEIIKNKKISFNDELIDGLLSQYK